MASTDWINVRGQSFSGNEAREASDFEEIVEIHALGPEEAYEMFKGDVLDVGKRLYFAEKVSVDSATIMLFLDGDDRVRKVVESRLEEYRKEKNGGILIT